MKSRLTFSRWSMMIIRPRMMGRERTRGLLSLRSGCLGYSTASQLTLLKERGLFNAQTSSGLDGHLSSQPRTVYAGFDPTAPSLHVGNLLAIIALLHFRHFGHSIIALIGGATGLIGDPSGRETERDPLSPRTLSDNSACIQAQLNQVFQNGSRYFQKRCPAPSQALHVTQDLHSAPLRIINNLDWYRQMSLLDFMSHTGRFARLASMLSRDSVKLRLDSPEGISFTEFSYQLFQAQDFCHLYTSHGCTVQIGGSDQRGNIVAGLDLIRRKENLTNPTLTKDDLAFGLTLPLVTTARGEKFGKSAGNAIWLDAQMLSPLDFYQFFRRSPDAMVEGYLKLFTCLSLSDIASLMSEHEKRPELHGPQRALAREVTELVHGELEAEKAVVKSAVLYDKAATSLSVKHIISCFEGDLRLKILSTKDETHMFSIAGCSAAHIVTLFVWAGLVQHEREGMELLRAGGLYVNYVKLTINSSLGLSDFIEGKLLILRRGKENYRMVIRSH